MKFAIHMDTKEGNFCTEWENAARKHGVEVFETDFRDVQNHQEIAECDAALWHWYHIPEDRIIAPKILAALEHLNPGLKIFPDWNTRWHYDEKVAQHYMFHNAGLPIVPSYVFAEEKKAMEFVDSAKYPLVFKLSVGAGSANVAKVSTREKARELVKLMFERGLYPYSDLPKVMAGEELDPSAPANSSWHHELQKNYVYFQEFIPNNSYDIRITVIGERAFAFTRGNRDNDFRASGSGKVQYDQDLIPRSAFDLAFAANEKLKMQSAAFDILMSEDDQPLINEVSYCYVSEAVKNCPGYWDRDHNFHPGNMWPEEAHIIDLITETKNS